MQGDTANLTDYSLVYEHCIKSPLYILAQNIFTALQIQTLPVQTWFPDEICFFFCSKVQTGVSLFVNVTELFWGHAQIFLKTLRRFSAAPSEFNQLHQYIK